MRLPLLFRWRAWPWAGKLGALLVLLAILPLSIVTIAGEAAARRQGVAESRARNLQRARTTAALLDRYLDNVIADVEILALSPATVRTLRDPADTASADELHRTLANIQSAKRIDVLLVLDHAGAVVASTDPALVGRDRISAQYFLSASAGQTGVYDPRYLADERGIYFNVSVPVRDESARVLGVAAARISPAEIDGLIAGDTGFGGLGEFGLLWDERGVAISAPARRDLEFRPLGTLLPFARDRLIAEQRFGPDTASLMRDAAGAGALVERSRWQMYDAGVDPHVSTDLRGTRMDVASVPLQQNRWTYGVAVPTANAVAAVRAQSRRNLAVALGMALIALVLAVAAAEWVARPVSRIAETARALAAGDMTRRVELKPTDEIGRMAVAFDSMADALAAKDAELRRHAESLERRVEERTAEVRELLDAMRFLARAGSTLASSLDYGNTVDTLARVAVPFLADLCVVDLLEHGRLRCAAVAATSPEREGVVQRMRAQYPLDVSSDHPVAAALRDGPLLLSDVSPSLIGTVARSDEHAAMMRSAGVRSAMTVPLLARGQLLGVVSFSRTDGGPPYEQADLAIAEELAKRAAIALDNARLYREVQEASRLKDEFLGIVSHELRTPLNAVLGWSQVLRRGKVDEEQASRALDAIDRNARAQAQLVDDLLDTSRVVSGKLRIDLAPTDVAAVVRQAVESFGPLARARGIDLMLHLAHDVGAIPADAGRLEQIVGNLLSNALKFTPPGGRVDVDVAPSGGQMEIRVTDSGIGIPPEFLPHVFERFRQADSTTTRMHGGLGIGLAIVRHLVQLHGGTIRAESAGENKGARFVVSLPGAPVPAAPRAAGLPPAEAAGPSLRGLRVLVVDDQPDTRDLLRTVLESAEARVVTAASAAEARRAIALDRPEVIVADIAMPGEDGCAFIRAVREDEARDGCAGRTRAIALTAYARDEDRERSLRAGFDRHLTKPVDPVELVHTVRELAPGPLEDAPLI